MTVNEVEGISAESIDSLFSGIQSQGLDTSPKLSKMKFSIKDGQLLLKGKLEYENKVINLRSTGDVYKNEKTDNA